MADYKHGSTSFIMNLASAVAPFVALSGVPVMDTIYSPGSYVSLLGVKVRTPSETVSSITPSNDVKSAQVMRESWSAPSLTTAVQV